MSKDVLQLTTRQARRLLLTKAGLLAPKAAGLPSKSRGSGKSAREAALRVIERFGYLQLDTVSIAGARSQALVLLSRLEGLKAETAEELLRPGVPLFEYWGHEASWIPLDLYPTLHFRRKAFRVHPWWGDIVTPNKKLARDIVKRIRHEGPLKSADLEGGGSKGWWDLKIAKMVAIAMWCSGELAIRERRKFQRTFDLPERVLPRRVLKAKGQPLSRAVESLLLRALDGHGVATTGILAKTWRLSDSVKWRMTNTRKTIDRALVRLQKNGAIHPCRYETLEGRVHQGWIRTQDLDLVDSVNKLRPRKDRGVLLSPFDPVLWDRPRVMDLFGFHQVLEIYTPEPKRTYGYFCLPVLAGEHLIGRVDLKADRKKGRLHVLSKRFESTGKGRAGNAAESAAMQSALERYSEAVGLEVAGRR